eukprot:1262785-Alexandrium_andersonii.AAC.1
MPRSTLLASLAPLLSRCLGAGASRSCRATVGRSSLISAVPRACAILIGTPGSIRRSIGS